MPLSKVIDIQKGNRVYSNQEWYHQHLLHGCWKLTCPYVAVNYHPSMYEPQVHPDYQLPWSVALVSISPWSEKKKKFRLGQKIALVSISPLKWERTSTSEG